MEASGSKRTRISDNQRSILERFYGDGMVGSGLVYKEKVDNAVAETGLTKAQVEKWIGNQKRLKRQNTSNSLASPHDDTLLKKSKHLRGPNAYNLFCSDFFKTDDCKGLSHSEKNKLASECWSLQNADVKKKYGETAKVVSSVKIAELDEKQKEKLIARHRKKLVEEIMILEDLGCQISSLLVDNMGDVYHVGSNEGNCFLSSNPEIGIKFREYFSASNRKYRRNDVQDLFNKRYSEAVGKNCRVPYLKGGFQVHGLPDGITFKKPYNYGNHQLKKIMESAEEIKFVLENNPMLSPPLSAPSIEPVFHQIEITNLLSKIAGSGAAERVLRSPQLTIVEEEIEVINLTFTEEEKLLLYAHASCYFSPDAWLAVGQNMRHPDSIEDLILPVYTTAEERFWLFQACCKPSRIAKCVYSTKVKGNWLNLQGDGSYNIIHSDNIIGKNIIRSAHGPLYFSYKSDDPSNFVLPDLIKFIIMKVLNESGITYKTV